MKTPLVSTLFAGFLLASAGSAYAGSTYLIIPNDTEGASRVHHGAQMREGRATLRAPMVHGRKMRHMERRYNGIPRLIVPNYDGEGGRRIYNGR